MQLQGQYVACYFLRSPLTLLFLRKLPLGPLTPTRLLCLSFQSFLPDVAGRASGGTSSAWRGIFASCPSRVTGGLLAFLRFPADAPRALRP